MLQVHCWTLLNFGEQLWEEMVTLVLIVCAKHHHQLIDRVSFVVVADRGREVS